MKKIAFILSSLTSLSAFAHTDFICYRDQYDMRDRKNPILAVNTNFSGEITSLQFKSDDNQVYTFTGRFNTAGDEVGTIQISDNSGNFIAIN